MGEIRMGRQLRRGPRWRDVEEAAGGVVDDLGSVDFTGPRVAGDVGGSDFGEVKEGRIRARLVFPDIEDAVELVAGGEQGEECAGINDFAARGLEEPRAGFEGSKAFLIKEVIGSVFTFVGERRVEGDDVGTESLINRGMREVGLSARAGWVGEDRNHAEGAGFGEDEAANVADADDGDGATGEGDSSALREDEESSDDVFGHRFSVGADGVAKSDALGLEVLLVNVIAPTCGGRNETDAAAFEESRVDGSNRANEEEINIADGVGRDGAAGARRGMTESRKSFVAARDIFIEENVHGCW